MIEMMDDPLNFCVVVLSFQMEFVISGGIFVVSFKIFCSILHLANAQAHTVKNIFFWYIFFIFCTLAQALYLSLFFCLLFFKVSIKNFLSAAFESFAGKRQKE